MSSDSEPVRGEVGVEERVDVDMFCVFSGAFEAEILCVRKLFSGLKRSEVAELAEIAEVESETALFPLLFLLNFVGLMKSAIG